MKAKKASSSTTKRPDAVFHGECFIFQSELPASAKEEKDLKGPQVIIANSEVTGNHHVIDRKPGVKFFKDGDRRFMQNEETTKVSCVIADRHTAIDLAPGTWEFGIAQEYDYFAEAKKNVADYILEDIASFKLREAIVCKDGATVSVQAGRWHYSTPRANAQFFSHVEAGFPTGYVPVSWRPYAENSRDLNSSIYAYIPFKLIEQYIEIHGGMVSGELPPQRTGSNNMKLGFLLKDSVFYNINSRGLFSSLWLLPTRNSIIEEQVRLKVTYAIYYSVNKTIETFVNGKLDNK